MTENETDLPVFQFIILYIFLYFGWLAYHHLAAEDMDQMYLNISYCALFLSVMVFTFGMRDRKKPINHEKKRHETTSLFVQSVENLITQGEKMKAYDFTQGNVLKQLVLFSTPIMLGNALQVSFQFIDSLWIGNLLGQRL